MRDRLLIFSGLFLFMAGATFPMWQGIAAKTSTPGPDLQLPTNQKACVAPRSYMRAAHMQLLINWREGAVREHGCVIPPMTARATRSALPTLAWASAMAARKSSATA